MYVTTEIRLEHRGWRTIDSAALRVFGSGEAIIREMSAILSDADVAHLCSALGILVTGFLFIDPVKQFTTFFNNETEGQSTYRTGYIWDNARMGEQWTEALHQLFVQVRAAQRTFNPAHDTRTEEFYTYLPNGTSPATDPFRSPHNPLAKDQCILYVPLGETLFTLILWRALLAQVYAGSPHAQLDLPPLRYRSIDLLSLGTPNIHKDLLALWSEVSSRSPRLQDLFRLLDISTTVGFDCSPNRMALSKFVAKLTRLPFKKCLILSDSDLLSAILGASPKFLEMLGHSIFPSEPTAQLGLLEASARFPVAPFYAWHVLDVSPKCYWVSPVWTSQQYSVVVRDGTSRHLGLALSAVRPLTQIDWTLYGTGLLSRRHSHRSAADPVVIANVLRLMARPLVEEHLYSSAVKQLLNLLQNATADAVKGCVGGDVTH